jgi:hypothetical protein
MRPLAQLPVNGKRCTVTPTYGGYALTVDGATVITDTSAQWLSNSALESHAAVVVWPGETCLAWEHR